MLTEMIDIASVAPLSRRGRPVYRAGNVHLTMILISNIESDDLANSRSNSVGYQRLKKMLSGNIPLPCSGLAILDKLDGSSGRIEVCCSAISVQLTCITRLDREGSGRCLNS